MPGAIIGGVRITALRLSAVTVVTTSAPLHASAVEPHAHDLQVRKLGHRREVARELGRRTAIDVVEPQFADADQPVERDRLEFALRAVADQRHDAAVGPREPLRRERRGRGRAQRRRHRELRQQQRIAGVHVREHAERHDREQALGRVPGVAVDVLEGIEPAVGGRHQLDDPDG